jgi:hypothetical protein
VTTQLKLYNEALLICGERQLSTVSDDVKTRYLLDSLWNNGAVDQCLASGQWRFAIRSQAIDYNSAIDPEFGYAYAFTKPSDWVATAAICSDEYYRSPLLDYVYEAGYWYADVTVLYVRYVSNHASYGTDYSNWPSLFADYVAHYLAAKLILDLTSDEKKQSLVFGLREKAMLRAKNHDAMGDPTKFPPSGTWSGSRGGGRRRDGGSRNNLIG